MRFSVTAKDRLCVLGDESLLNDLNESCNEYEQEAELGEALVYNLTRSGNVNFDVLIDEQPSDVLIRCAHEAQTGLVRIPSGRLVAKGSIEILEIEKGNYAVTLRNIDPKRYQKAHEAELHAMVGPAGRIIGAIGCMPVLGVISLPFVIGALVEIYKDRPNEIAESVLYFLSVPILMIAIPLLLFRLKPFAGAQEKIRAFWDKMPNATIELRRLDDTETPPQSRVFNVG